MPSLEQVEKVARMIATLIGAMPGGGTGTGGIGSVLRGTISKGGFAGKPSVGGARLTPGPAFGVADPGAALREAIFGPAANLRGSLFGAGGSGLSAGGFVSPITGRGLPGGFGIPFRRGLGDGIAAPGLGGFYRGGIAGRLTGRGLPGGFGVGIIDPGLPGFGVASPRRLGDRTPNPRRRDLRPPQTPGLPPMPGPPPPGKPGHGDTTINLTNIIKVGDQTTEVIFNRLTGSQSRNMTMAPPNGG